MAEQLRLCVITAESTVFDEPVSYVNIPTSFGSLGILKGHAPMLCAVDEGVIKANYPEEGGVLIRVGKGIAEVSDNTVTVMAASAEIKG